MKRIMKSILERLGLFQFLPRVTSCIGIIWATVCRMLGSKQYCIVKIEGGLTSQIEQYVLGRRLAELGIRVKYDISWYVDGKGVDCLGINARNFDLKKLDKGITLDVASEKEVSIFRRFFPFSNRIEECQSITKESLPKLPVYLGGYGYGLYSETEFEDTFSNNLRINYDIELFGNENERLLDEIRSLDDTVAVHVRRGDTLLPEVGRPIPQKEYYLEALRYFDTSCKVFFFSDDPEWVKTEVIPYVENCERCVMVELNGADKGWCDLILMSACKYQIKSPAGGMARDAYRLNKNLNKCIVVPTYIAGNMSGLRGNIKEIVIDEKLCDMRYVKNRNIRL